MYTGIHTHNANGNDDDNSSDNGCINGDNKI